MKLENPIYESDPYLADFKPDLDRRHEKMAKTISSIEGKKMTQFLSSTRTGWSRIERFSLGPRTEPDQDRKILEM